MDMDFEMEAFSEFLSKYPAYKDTMVVDSLRHEEYPHLDEKGLACLDYTGVGLFSSSQKSHGSNGGVGIAFSHTSSNLATHAMYVEESSTESFFRKRILRYLNLSEDDYYLVFTANAFSAFKLLGASYPFHEASNLILAYDHRCENTDALSDCASAKSACIQSVALSFPQCKIDTDDLNKKLQCKKKVHAQKVRMKKGLFAFPYSSRVTGCRNSSRWIPRAQQDGWHVLLDVTSVDAKMLDSLGLSLFLPDFMICSFYNVFGEDPMGLGCLAIKKSVLKTLGDSSRARAIGMVKIVNKGDSSIPSSFSLPAKRKNEHKSGLHSQYSVQDSPLRSPKDSFSFEPEWSADLGAIDNNLFYQSNGDAINLFQAVLDEDQGLAHSATNGKGISYANSSRMHTYESKKGITDGDMPISNGVIDHRENGFMSCPIQMEDQIVHSGSFRSTSTREWDERDLNFSRPFRIQSALLQDDMGIGLNWQGRASEIEEIEPLYSHRGNPMMVVNGNAKKHVYPEPSTIKSLKGLFYGDAVCRRSADRTSLRKLFRHESKSRVAAYLQRAGQIHSREVLTLNDWVTFYAAKAKAWSSTSSNASSSAPSSRRFGMSDPLDRENHAKAVGVSMQNRVVCKGLDHADMLGYKRIAVRLRSLGDWLVASLSSLQHPPPKCFKLVKLCSQMSLQDRGSTVAFTLLDSSGKAFDLTRVQLLADRNNISIRTGVMEGTLSMESREKEQQQADFTVGCVELAGYKCYSKDDIVQQLQLPVLYVSLGFLNNFSDVYRLWRFVCRFLDPQFVDRELWHYQALNQETIEI